MWQFLIDLIWRLAALFPWARGHVKGRLWPEEKDILRHMAQMTGRQAFAGIDYHRSKSPCVTVADVELGNPDDEYSRLRYLDALKRLKEKGFVHRVEGRDVYWLTSEGLKKGERLARRRKDTRPIRVKP